MVAGYGQEKLLDAWQTRWGIEKEKNRDGLGIGTQKCAQFIQTVPKDKLIHS